MSSSTNLIIMFVITVIIATASIIFTKVSTEQCSSFKYATLSIDEVLLLDEDRVLVGTNLSVFWSDGIAAGMWLNDEFLSGNIKSSIKTYFGISNLTAISILNSVGKDGWEAFSHIQNTPEDRQFTNEWYFKKCKAE